MGRWKRRSALGLWRLLMQTPRLMFSSWLRMVSGPIPSPANIFLADVLDNFLTNNGLAISADFSRRTWSQPHCCRHCSLHGAWLESHARLTGKSALYILKRIVFAFWGQTILFRGQLKQKHILPNFLGPNARVEMCPKFSLAGPKATFLLMGLVDRACRQWIGLIGWGKGEWWMCTVSSCAERWKRKSWACSVSSCLLQTLSSMQRTPASTQWIPLSYLISLLSQQSLERCVHNLSWLLHNLCTGSIVLPLSHSTILISLTFLLPK